MQPSGLRAVTTAPTIHIKPPSIAAGPLQRMNVPEDMPLCSRSGVEVRVRADF
jgi:hypothetical protein